MSTFTTEVLQKLRAIEESGTRLARNTVLNLIERATEANQAEARAEADEKRAADWRGVAESAEQIIRGTLEAMGSHFGADPIIKARELLARAEAAEALVAERDKELLQIQGPCRAPGCGLHRAHNGPCGLRTLDGEP